MRLVGLAVTAVGSVLVAYALTLIWAFVGIIVAAQGGDDGPCRRRGRDDLVALVVTTAAIAVLRRRRVTPSPFAAGWEAEPRSGDRRRGVSRSE
ncbi:hypothetical protein [Gordonia bronchialis]|uniref:hypothetical protein n=1 Tax=Gordonia bronchialis TaxID=2054 RepID=UPI00242ED381|nr:hypothetical protein [Gordonia bronchialis]